MIMQTVKSTLAAAFLAAFCCAPLAAHAGLFDDEEARKAILDLRGKIDALRRDTRADLDGKADKAGTLDLVNQNEQQRQEIAKLRGQVEVLTNEMANTQQRQKDFYVDLDSRLRKMEPHKVTVDGKEANVEPTEQKAYDAGLAFFKAGDYRNSAAALADFVRRYPQSGYSASAHYWLGNAYYAQRDYRSAITAQQTVVNNFPESQKVADALLNIASCYTELKDKPAAKKSLETLVEKYPESPAAQTAKERLNSLK
jgi:tol-pal system protein YbgF